MLWQGEEFGENYFLPEFGAGRVALLRALRWDFFYDAPGQGSGEIGAQTFTHQKKPSSASQRCIVTSSTIGTVYLSKGLLLFARYSGPAYTLVAINTSDVDQTVPFWFPIGGNYLEELHGGDLNLSGIVTAAGNVADAYPPTTVASGPRSDPNNNTTVKSVATDSSNAACH